MRNFELGKTELLDFEIKYGDAYRGAIAKLRNSEKAEAWDDDMLTLKPEYTLTPREREAMMYLPQDLEKRL